jgi:preprotein translocase subunit SecB
MQLSPLQLMEYSFEGVSITPVEGFDNAKRDPSLAFTSDGMKLQSEAGISVLKEGEKHSDYGLRFTLIVGAKEGSAVPYDIRVSVAGGVRLYGGGTQEERQKLALVNGISLLCGVVRDLVALVTSRSRHGQMLLPTLNFAKLAEQHVVAVSAATPQKASPSTAKPLAVKKRPGSTRRKP